MIATVLIIRRAGFNGSHAVDALLAAGERVCVLDDFSAGRRENLAGTSGALEAIEGDVRECEAVATAMRGYDRMLHPAAIVSVTRSVDDPATGEGQMVPARAQAIEAATPAPVATPQPVTRSAPPPP
jgi:UDP-glucose 4-epimerase